MIQSLIVAVSITAACGYLAWRYLFRAKPCNKGGECQGGSCGSCCGSVRDAGDIEMRVMGRPVKTNSHH